MQQLLTLSGHIAAVLGILLCAAAGLARLSGSYHLAGYEATTLFMVGIGVMVFACVVKLEALTQKNQK
jgi:type IV secretory pathway VirB2 component (pilin)